MLAIFLLLSACGGGGTSATTPGGNTTQTGTNASVVAKTSIIPPGDATCAFGGILVETGIDENSNGVLDVSEVDASEKVCNGAPGTNGATGTNGAPGTNGGNGLNSLITLNTEPSGVNCPSGGMRIDAGIDTNNNGTLDTTEITQTGFVCSGSNGSIGWQVAELIESDNAGSAFVPQIAVGASGDAVAVWSQFDGTFQSIWANRYVVGIGWGVAELIETSNAGDARATQVKVDASGNMIAVWHQSDGIRNNIWSNRYIPGFGWGTAELIETDNTGDAVFPQVAVNASGNAVAVWDQTDSTRNNIWANRYMVGVGWGTAELIETNNVGTALLPQVAVEASGNAMAVWEQSDGTRFNIWANRFVAGVGWGVPELLETDDAGAAIFPRVAVDVSGNMIAVWQQSDGTVRNIWSNRYVVGSGWGVPELLETDNAGDAFQPKVVVNTNGNAVAIWDQFDGTRSNIWANHYIVGVGWGVAELIETSNAGEAFVPEVAVDASGNAVAVWEQSDGMRNNIWSNRYMAGIGWGVAQLIETDNAADALTPQVGVDANGNAMAAWQQSDSTRFNIWSNRWLVQ